MFFDVFGRFFIFFDRGKEKKKFFGWVVFVEFVVFVVGIGLVLVLISDGESGWGIDESEG